jgi:hypothetical protein
MSIWRPRETQNRNPGRADRRGRDHVPASDMNKGLILKQFESLFIPEPTSGCWLWIGSYDSNGYGRFWITADGGHTQAHIVSYERKYGPVPEGLELDHKCRVRCCVNPDHVEPVTHLENVRRGESKRVTIARHKLTTHCPRGHPYDETNTIWKNRGLGHVSRGCRTCRRQYRWRK